MCFRNNIAGKKPNKKNVLKLYKSYQKQQHIQQSVVKQTPKKAKPEINVTEKENVEKNKEKTIEIDNKENHNDTSVIEDNSETNEGDVDFRKDKVNLKDKLERKERIVIKLTEKINCRQKE